MLLGCQVVKLSELMVASLMHVVVATRTFYKNNKIKRKYDIVDLQHLMYKTWNEAWDNERAGLQHECLPEFYPRASFTKFGSNKNPTVRCRVKLSFYNDSSDSYELFSTNFAVRHRNTRVEAALEPLDYIYKNVKVSKKGRSSTPYLRYAYVFRERIVENEDDT